MDTAHEPVERAHPDDSPRGGALFARADALSVAAARVVEPSPKVGVDDVATGIRVPRTRETNRT
ncbi:hypothetical protein [Nocardia australiensis]|uniref:hypothetical protein n=1 Tax=Nocardia australiensis TaxID=2887191 RepID=UPI001D133E8F|nr:hypothetical protein [Nocardia australiensis]